MDTVGLAGLAERQWGVLTRAQLERSGLSASGISWALKRERLHLVHPGVYALGHRRLSTEGRLYAAILYGGPGAMLSHVTAAWWWQLWGSEPRWIHISTARHARSTAELRVHRPRDLDGTCHRGLPVTTVARTLLDHAATVRFEDVRRALAEADYRNLVDFARLDAVARRGRSGSAALRKAIRSHRPELAQTRSVLEERFLALCEAHGIALPEVNPIVEGVMVDMLWRAERVVVELDGHAAHANPAAIERDRRRELRLRAAGHLVLRYTWQQITQQPDEVAADLIATLALRAVRSP
jgi:very-short-patch-repair endonuclease